MKTKGRPRNPECPECGAPTNKEYEYIAGDDHHCILYQCRRSVYCGSVTYDVLEEEYY